MGGLRYTGWRRKFRELLDHGFSIVESCSRDEDKSEYYTGALDALEFVEAYVDARQREESHLPQVPINVPSLLQSAMESIQRIQKDRAVVADHE